MAQQDTDQQHAGVLPVDDEGFVIDTEQAEERELAYRESSGTPCCTRSARTSPSSATSC